MELRLAFAAASGVLAVIPSPAILAVTRTRI
jgi:hypothetical protein